MEQTSQCQIWLAQCTDPKDHFPPRFLYVLLLRLVFRFTLSTPRTSGLAPTSSPDLQRRCSMWSTGVYWSMEEGVKFVVELVNHSRSVIVLVKSNNETSDNFSRKFNEITDCVKETMSQFCCQKSDFFLLNSIDEADYFNGDNMYAMPDVERILACPEGKEVIISISGDREMAISRLSLIKVVKSSGQQVGKDLESSKQDQQLAATNLCVSSSTPLYVEYAADIQL